MKKVIKKKVSAAERAAKTQAAALQRVIERGIVQFRADEEIMELLLRVAMHKRVPYGVMCRAWVVERLRQEARILEQTA
jgi:hypothetical protein